MKDEDQPPLADEQRPAAQTAAPVGKSHVAGGAATVALSRLGAAIEVITQPVYTWLFGLTGYGVYIVAWSAVNFIENIVDLALTSVLQRLVPRAPDEERAHAVLKLALLIGVIPSIVIALAASLWALPLSALLNAAPDDRKHLALAIAIFAWVLPLWTFIEIATSAVRARHAFGPEVRLRLFWEQLLRLLLAVLGYVSGFGLTGLFAAHVLSLAATAFLSLRLIGRYYDLRLLWQVRTSAADVRGLLSYGMALLPGNIIRRALADLPAVVLNALLPGAAGASAAALYGIARKLSAIPQLVRQTFSYVMAPLVATQARHDVKAIQPLYAFATRLSAAVVIPLSMAMMLLGAPILTLFAPGAAQALPLLIVLVGARMIEAIIGPAGPVLDILGHRRWLLVNSGSGLLTWLILSILLVKTFAGLGMAIAVAGGILVPALLALIRLRIANRLDALSGRLGIGVGVGILAAVLFAIAKSLAAPFGAWAQAMIVCMLLPPALWAGLRFGLKRSDREALGRPAARLRLI